MTQVTVCIPGRVPHRIAESALKKFTARYPDALVAFAAPVEAMGTAADHVGDVPLQSHQKSKPPSRLKKAELIELLRTGFSFQPPREWNRKRLIDELNSRRLQQAAPPASESPSPTTRSSKK